MFQQIQVPASSVPAGAEFGIYVSGDSMEPRYHNGQIVWVKSCEELECGDIGIFVYDDCGYLKKYDEHTPDKSQAEFLTDSYGVVHNQPVLVSLNTKYSPILISPNLCVLAKKCGISYSTIQTTARRGGQLSVETIERICQGLGITLKDFFDSS